MFHFSTENSKNHFTNRINSSADVNSSFYADFFNTFFNGAFTTQQKRETIIDNVLNPLGLLNDTQSDYEITTKRKRLSELLSQANSYQIQSVYTMLSLENENWDFTIDVNVLPLHTVNRLLDLFDD